MELRGFGVELRGFGVKLRGTHIIQYWPLIRNTNLLQKVRIVPY